MFHLSGYTLLIGAVANTDIPAIQDDIVQIQNNHFILPQSLQLMAAFAGSPTIIDSQIVSPTIRQINPTYVRPVNTGALPAANSNLAFQFGGGMFIKAFEEVQMLGSAAPGTTERFTGLVWLQDQYTPPPQGAVYVVRWSSTGTAVANLWTSIQFSVTNVLPSGIYMMIQSEHWSTNAIAHRWIYSNQVWRAGHLSQAGPGGRLPDHLLVNWLGAMGQFRSNDLPRLQVLCNAADAVHTGTMWLVRIGNLAG